MNKNSERLLIYQILDNLHEDLCTNHTGYHINCKTEELLKILRDLIE